MLINLGKTLLSHGSEAGTIRKQGELCLPSAEMKFLEEICQLQSFGPQRE